MASLALTLRGHLLFTAEDGTFQPPLDLLRRLASEEPREEAEGFPIVVTIPSLDGMNMSMNIFDR
jgi:hypothetical protein